MMHGRHQGESGMHWMHAFGNDFGMIWMILFWIILIGVVVYLISKLIKSSNKESPGEPKEHQLNSSSLQILQERLAKGEIDEAEYERLKTVIKKDE